MAEPKPRTVEIIDLSYQPSQEEMKKPIEIPSEPRRCTDASAARRGGAKAARYCQGTAR